MSGEQEREPKAGRTGRETYNIVSDTITGVNVRRTDNLIQAAVVVVFAILGTALGLLASEGVFGVDLEFSARTGAVVGVTTGMVVGLLVSGLAIGLFRLYKHASGQHE